MDIPKATKGGDVTEPLNIVHRFPSPFDVETAAGADGWEQMYPYYFRFSEENREWEDGMLWYQDGVHHSEVLFPFDTITHECWRTALGQYNSRIFAIPPAYGIEQRIVNGYLYIAAVPVSSEKRMEERVEVFMRRAGHYYANWDNLFDRWKLKMTDLIETLEKLEVPHLSRLDEEEVVTEARGISAGWRLVEAYNAVIENMFVAWQYHFEMLNIGYAGFLNLFMFCKQAFPGIRDELIAQMVAGSELLFFRPDDELKRLAQLGIDLGLADKLRVTRKPEEILQSLRSDPGAQEWVSSLDEIWRPWFYFSNGAGFYHHHRSWIDDLTVPWSALTGYIDRLEKGESLERPRQEILDRRERLVAEYRELLPTEEDKATFDENVSLARTVAPYIEDHNFYVEHWHHTVWWNKVREFGDRLVEGGFLEDREDMFFMNRWELGEAFADMVGSWATGGPSSGLKRWRKEVANRKRIFEALKRWSPLPALGPVPAEITEPFTVMLWGITTERVKVWLGLGEAVAENEIQGVPASPGVAEGQARVILAASEIDQIEQDEILVCPITAPSWGPVFSKVQAAVSDIGGMMCHAAIVSREYGLPAVVGTGTGTKRIKTGDTVRVDGNTGLVTIVSRHSE